jgi:hypothetical protein
MAEEAFALLNDEERAAEEKAAPTSSKNPLYIEVPTK